MSTLAAVNTSPGSRTDSAAWRPAADLDTLRLRAGLLARLRQWFAERPALEVETPALSSAAGTDVHLESLRVAGLGWLHTSPEFPMKRLLAAGSGDIFQIARVFRGGERGRRHNPEFTLLEWYRVGVDYRALRNEVLALLAWLGDGRTGWDSPRILRHAEALALAGIDAAADSAAQVGHCLEQHDVPVPDGLAGNREALLDLAMSTVVEARFDPARPTVVEDYPPEQAALARIRQDTPPVAERFEVFLGGMEIANGFGELTDAREQRRRFEEDLARRGRRGQTVVPVDQRFLQALESGLPACSGVAVGVDRLTMLLAGAEHIDEVLAFPMDRA